jgi:NADH-quinone oxidoreductase subunit H
MNFQIVFLILGFFLVCGLTALSTILLYSPWRHQAVVGLSRIGGFSTSDTNYVHSLTSSLSEILKRILPFVIPASCFLILSFLFMPASPAWVGITPTGSGDSSYAGFLLIHVGKALGIIVPLLIGVAYLTLLERKVMASIQRRKGPNVVGLYGLLQPLADGLKLFLKESILPAGAHNGMFILSPILTFFLAVIGWAAVPFDEGFVYAEINIGILYIFAVSSLGVYGVICSGWSSNTKYSFLGALRSSAQMISYEIGIGFILLLVFLLVGSLNLTDIVIAQEQGWFFIPLFPAIMIWLVCILAETNRAPFDLPEAEAELVAGYFTEYSAIGFALFFLGEYSNMILMSSLTAILFFGGWLGPFLPGSIWFGFKVVCVLFGFIWVRAAFPRYRFDQLMALGWKVFLPFLLGYYMWVAGFLYTLDWLPN